MRIGVDARCLEWNRGGVARYLINVLKNWSKNSDSNRYILYFQNYIPQDNFLINKKFELKLIKGPSFLKKHRILTEQLLFPFELKKDKLDTFFATWYSAPLLKGETKTIVAAWDISYSSHPHHYSFFDRVSLGIFSKWSCKNANGIITCSDYDALQIENFYKISKEKIKTVYLSADERFSPTKDEKKINKLKDIYKLPEKFILSMGVIHNRRNVDKIIDAFESLKNDFPEFSLVVIGRNATSPRIDIERKMDKLIKEKKAIYMSWFEDEDLPSLYQSASFYICTSTVDGETLMLKEAMKCGTCVITSSLLSGSIGKNGFIISDPENVKEISNVIKKAILAEEAVKKFINEGLDWNKRFDWKTVADESLDFIKKSINS